MEQTDYKTRIIEATIDVFNDKGNKFTMDDIAKRLGMSKKTIYCYFKDKESLLYQTIDYAFTQIKKSESEIVVNDKLTTLEKLKRILIVLPDRYKNIDFRKIYFMKDAYPKEYKRIENRIESEWEPTIQIIRQGIKEGVIRNISIPVFKTIVESTIKSFISDNSLFECNLSYEDALKELLDIIISGIVVNRTDV